MRKKRDVGINPLKIVPEWDFLQIIKKKKKNETKEIKNPTKESCYSTIESFTVFDTENNFFHGFYWKETTCSLAFSLFHANLYPVTELYLMHVSI